MWVVKLGGSLLGSPELKDWLERLVKFSDGRVVIVPGGGIFADAVRIAQQRSNISDAAAHELALMAMDQFGLLLAAMNPDIVTASSELEIAERGWQHRCIVWLPSQMVLADDKIPQNWQVTSDSLSAWLATKLNVKQLILVKSKLLSNYSKSEPTPLQELVEDALIDDLFGDFIAGQHYQTWLLNKADSHMFDSDFSQEKLESLGLLVSHVSH
ncbi:amino acid kinase family protein [mine drainage metagenome]|uniref:Amino acid kinase family protein n=1 Tax=mine drainage metagenome TaxID=410659 RepID=A0A1J5TC62_9ZZZZ